MVDQWRVFIYGPSGTPYENKWWYLFVTFPDAFPTSPPIFRFITIPYHINISNEGRICMNTIGNDYLSTSTVMELIGQVKCLLLVPNYEDPIDIEKLTLYNESKTKFNQKIIESTTKAKSSYTEYLDGISVNDNAPVGFEVQNEVYVPPHNRCPISGKVLDPKNTVLASSGIKYDRDALKNFLRSSTTVHCVIKGVVLTDDPNSL